MVVKPVTTSDLLALEIKLNWELEEKIKTRHHALAWKVQEDYNKIDSSLNEYRTEVLLNKQSLQRMEKDIEEIKTMLRELTKSLPNTYVSKDELLPIKEKQKSHDDTIAWVVRGIVVGFISLIAWLVWLSKYM